MWGQWRQNSTPHCHRDVLYTAAQSTALAPSKEMPNLISSSRLTSTSPPGAVAALLPWVCKTAVAVEVQVAVNVQEPVPGSLVCCGGVVKNAVLFAVITETGEMNYAHQYHEAKVGFQFFYCKWAPIGIFFSTHAFQSVLVGL